MLQRAGDFGLEQEPPAAGRVVGVPVPHRLEGDLPVQLLVVGDEDLAEAAGGVGPQDAEPPAVGLRRASVPPVVGRPGCC